MANLNQNNRSGGRRNFGDRSSNRASMHPATCSNCGKACEVPFRPTGSKPVYCSDCFETKGGAAARRYEDINTRKPHFSGRSNFRGKEVYDAVCDKCGKNCKLPFRPTNGKPIYCTNCFEEKGAGRNHTTESCQCHEKIEVLNMKLDQILKLLTSERSPKTEINQIDDLINKPLDFELKEKVSTKKKPRISKKEASA